ncbi:hypothetical protein [Cellulomonas xiejunii]|uniref:hypothetical protein n=1 Tax=Cellulomonas xiejunii TaxID=2968083 RepID=UPI001D0E3F0B|nr:hypothetical protein [Cellulomonas xiejunii]MCC2313710.1 hypothetical protein [Cellulomonas xiejunii]
MNRRRALAATAAAALVLTVPVGCARDDIPPGVLPATLPTATPTTPAPDQDTSGSAPAIPQPDPTAGVTTDQQQQTSSGSLFGTRTIAPGFDETREWVVRNDGSVPAELVVSVVEARMHTEPRDDFYDDLTVNGIPASRLAGRDTAIHTELLAPGASAVVPVRLTFATASTSGNAAVVGEETFSFGLRADLTDASERSDVLTQGDVRGPLAQTGGLARTAGPWLVLAAGALALAWAVADRRRGEPTG